MAYCGFLVAKWATPHRENLPRECKYLVEWVFRGRAGFEKIGTPGMEWKQKKKSLRYEYLRL